MSVTIDSLDIQIRSSAGSAAKNINDLADALGKLSANSKLTKTVNALGNLNKALSDMKGQQSVMSHLSSLSKSLSSLAAIPKLTGLQSAIRELKKLPDVMKSLDTAEISQFTAKMKLLASGLSPLATQIEKISRGFSKLPPQVSKCVTAVKRLDSANRSAAKSTKDHGVALNNQSINFMTAYENLSNVLSMMHGIQDAVAKVLNDAIQWDGIQFQFGRAFGEDADEVLAYAEKVSEALNINQQQFMESASLYGSLLKGFGVEQDLVTTMGIGLTELSYDIWAAYNNRYKTLDDASEAVRSAITGEIEPIRNAGIALTEASMQEYLDSVGKAHISVEKLTEAQKSELRYATMVNAAMNQGIIGTYAREMETAEGAVRTLTQQLKTLGQAFGSLFIPVLKVVIPYLSAFVELITEGVIALGAMFGIKFQEITWGDAKGMAQTAEGADATASALGDAAKSAKAMKDYTMGFDELNIIKPDSAASGAGAGGAGGVGSGDSLGLGLDTLWDDAVLANASKQVDELKEKIKDFYNKWKLQIDTIGVALSVLSIGSLLTKLGEALNLGNLFLGTMTKIKNLAIGAIIITLQYSLATEFLGSYLDGEGFKNYVAAMFVNALGTWVMYSKFGPAGLVIGLAVTAAASIKALIDDGGIHGVEGVVTALTGLASAAAAVGIAFKALKKTDLGAAFSLLKDGEKLGGVLAALFPNAANIASSATTWVTGKLVPTVTSAITKLPSLLAVAAKALPWVALIAAIVGAITLVVVDYDFTDIGYKIGHALGTVLKKIGEWLGAAGDWIADVGKAIWDGIVSAWEWVKETFDINTVFDLIFVMFNVQTWLDEILPKLIEIGKEVLPGLWQGIKDGWNNFWGNVGEFIDGFIQGFKDGLGIASPSTVFAEIGEYVIEGLLNGIKEKWKALKTWFSTNVAPKLTLDYWKPKFDVIKQAVSSKLEEVKQTVSSKWSAIKTWFTTNVAPKFTLDYWKTKFDVIKQAISSKLDEFKQTATEKWDNIKTWFTDNIAPKFTLTFWLDKFKNLKEGFTQTIKNAVNAGIDLMNRFIGWVNEHLNFSWDPVTILGKTVVPGGSVQLFTIPQIPHLADGGFVDAGQMFVAREAGPELVGSINGRTAVANNDQIVAAVSQGVYEAVAAAMGANHSSGSQNINVYLDGKQIHAVVKKRDSERGMQLMGNQLGYAY